MIRLWLCLALVSAVFGLGISNCLAEDNVIAEAISSPGLVPRRLLVMLRLPPPHFRPDASYGGRYNDDAGRRTRHRIAEELARLHDLTLIADWPMPVAGIDCYVMGEAVNAPPGTADALARDPRVEWVQPMQVFKGLNGSDPLYPVQPAAKYWHVAELHGVATGRNVRVAMIDSGVEDKHPDLAGQIVLQENFVDGRPHAPETHGTAVAGIIAARAGNGAGIEGIAPAARLMALRACWQQPDQSTQCNSFTLGKALNFAIMHDAHVINLSLTGPTDRLLQRLLDVALARRIKVVGAVDPDVHGGGFPASHPGVFAVAGEQSKDAGTNALVAPGRDIPTTMPGGRWGFVSGASYAAAHVSGMMALLTELQPGLTPAQIRESLVINSRSSGEDLAGTIDACATIKRTAGTCACSCTTVQASKATHYP